jgi:23S rRNA (pseudouridine1915-N3)-methyltransferase
MAPGSLNGVLLLWVGRRAPEPFEALADEFEVRLARHLPLATVRLRPASGRGGDPKKALAEEADAIRRHIGPGDTVVALDEGGRERTTEELASWFGERRRHGRTVFVIGSDLGLDGGFKAGAHERLALSRLTLPHALARVVLLEQLYRACDLLAGGQYHRATLG